MHFHFPIFQFYLIRDDGFEDWHGNNHLWGWLGMGNTVAGMGIKATGMGRGWGGDGDNVENSSGDGMGMGMTSPGTVGDGDKYLSPCSPLVPRPRAKWRVAHPGRA